MPPDPPRILWANAHKTPMDTTLPHSNAQPLHFWQAFSALDCPVFYKSLAPVHNTCSHRQADGLEVLQCKLVARNTVDSGC